LNTQQQQQQQQQCHVLFTLSNSEHPSEGFPTPDPKLQAIIKQDFQQVLLKLSADKNSALCTKHSLQKCHSCDIDIVHFTPALNTPLPTTCQCDYAKDHATHHCCQGGRKHLSQLFSFWSHLHSLMHSIFSSQNQFKLANYSTAITQYATAAAITISWPSQWESNQLMCEKLPTIIANHSTPYFESQD
jgi:hypothetical protein